ncbi:MAG: hypothetical protein ACYSR9_15905 [Planctomycetota bacterium]|jgi:hypothetical protein
MQIYRGFSKSFKTWLLCVIVAVSVISLHPLGAGQYPPVFDFESLLNTYFDDESGLISFQDGRIIFAPDGSFNGQIAVLNSANKIVADFSFYNDYKVKNGVYARALVQTPADVTLTNPDIYTIVWLVDGKPVTRLPVRLEVASGGDDPFNPGTKFSFDGYWRTFAFLTDVSDSDDIPELHYWLGGKDLAPGKNTGKPFIALYRDGKMVAHNKKQGPGIIRSGHFDRAKSFLYFPHEVKKSPNAVYFRLKDWLVDGKYEIRVTRLSDGEMIRSFDFNVSGGKFEEHPRTKFGYEPQTDFIAPRVQKKGSSSLELETAIWIEDR